MHTLSACQERRNDMRFDRNGKFYFAGAINESQVRVTSFSCDATVSYQIPII